MKAIHGTFVSIDAVLEEIQIVRGKHLATHSPDALSAKELTPEGKAVYEAMMELYGRIWKANNESERM